MNSNDLYVQFRLLFRELYNPLTQYAYTFVRDHVIAEDIVQEVFVRIWEKHASIIESHQARPYLYRAVRNACFNHLGSKKRIQLFSLSDTELEDADSITWTVWEEEDEDDIPNYRELLKKAIDHLPEKCREIFLLKRSGQLSNQEIADHLGISIKTVNNQTWKAMKLLKAFIYKTKSWLWPFITYFFTRL